MSLVLQLCRLLFRHLEVAFELVLAHYLQMSP
jgi:hypothetical protein